MIETIADFLAIRPMLQPVRVLGKRGQAVPFPCANTLVVRRELVQANTYNPNSVPRDRMELLYQSVVDNGFAFPIVTIFDPELGKFVIVDGFHRYLISGPDWLDLPYVPVVVLDHAAADRIYATWQFNKARGVHQVDLDADLIRTLIEQGESEDRIAERLGVDLDTVFRYKQVTGVAELFRNANYSMAWEIAEVEDAK